MGRRAGRWSLACGSVMVDCAIETDIRVTGGVNSAVGKRRMYDWKCDRKTVKEGLSVHQ